MESRKTNLWKWRNGAYILILLLYFGKHNVAAITLLEEYVLEAGGLESHCNEAITSKPSVVLLSQPGAGLFGGLTSYKADQNCPITFEAKDGEKILLQFPFFDLQPPNNDATCIDKVMITELGVGSSQVTDICTDQVFVSVTDKIEVKFLSDAATQRKGFKALITSFHEGACTDSEFQCDTNRCISADLKCDGNNHCVDQADESKELAGCSLGDQILNKITGLGKYGMLAVGALAAALIFTIFASVLLWKCVKSDNKCCRCSNSSNDDPESVDSFPSSPNTSQGKKQSKKTENITDASQKSKKGKKVIKVKGKDEPDIW